MTTVPAILRQPLARQRGEQFVLAVAGDAGDAEDFAALDLERDVLEPHAVRIVRLEAEIVDDQPRHRGLRGWRRPSLADLAADHHARQRGRGLRRGSQVATFLPPRRMVAVSHSRFTSSSLWLM